MRYLDIGRHFQIVERRGIIEKYVSRGAVARGHGGAAWLGTGLLVGLLIALTVSAKWAAAQPGPLDNTGDIDATISIIRAIQIEEMRALEFGDIIAGNTGASTLIVRPDSSVLTTGSATFLGPFQSAQFRISGEAGLEFQIEFPAPAKEVKLLLSRNTQVNMAINGWATNLQGNRVTLLPNGGIFDLFIGGTLRVGPQQQPGLYTSTFSVSVAYN